MRFIKLTERHYTRAPSFKRGPYETERKRHNRRQLQQISVISFFVGFIITLIFLGGRAKASSLVIHTSGMEPWAGGGQVTSEELPQHLTLRIEIKNYICKKFGKDCEDALKIAYCESRYNPEAVGVNKSSVDRGVFQLNTVHHHITSSCAFDARCNIDQAYELFKKQGWTPWVCRNLI